MSGLQDYLKEFNAESVDISKINSFKPFYRDHIELQANTSAAESIVFFKMIYNKKIKELNPADISKLNEVYQLSDSERKKQLENFISKGAVFDIQQAHTLSEYKSIIGPCERLILYTSRLLKNKTMTFEQSLAIYRTVLDIAYDPKNEQALSKLTELATEYGDSNIFGKLGAYIQILVGTVLDYLGYNEGKNMVADAKIKLNMKNAFFVVSEKSKSAQKDESNEPRKDFDLS